MSCPYADQEHTKNDQFRGHTRGKTTSGLNTITTSDVRACEMYVPPLALQRRYADIVENTREVAAAADFGSQTASLLGASLMAGLLGEFA